MLPRSLFILDDLPPSVPPCYDVDQDFSPVALGEDLSFVPVTGRVACVPLLDASRFDVDETVVKLLMFSAGEKHVADSVESAVARAKGVYSVERDLAAANVLTGGLVPEGAERLHDGTPVYDGVRFIVTDLLPKDEVLVVADPEFTGFLATRDGLVGLLFSNKNSVMRFRISPN